MQKKSTSITGARAIFQEALLGALSLFTPLSKSPSHAVAAVEAVLGAGVSTLPTLASAETPGQFLGWAGSLVALKASAFDKELARSPLGAREINAWRDAFADAFSIAIAAPGASRTLAAAAGPAWMVERFVMREKLTEAERWSCVEKMAAWSTLPKLAHLNCCLPFGQSIFSPTPSRESSVATAFSGSLWQKAERIAIAAWRDRKVNIPERVDETSFFRNYWMLENGAVVAAAFDAIGAGGAFDAASAIGIRVFAPPAAPSSKGALAKDLPTAWEGRLSPGMVEPRRAVALMLLAPEHSLAWTMSALCAACHPSADLLGAGLLRLCAAPMPTREPLVLACLGMANRLAESAELMDSPLRPAASRPVSLLSANPLELGFRAALSNKPKGHERRLLQETLSKILAAGLDPWNAPPEGGPSSAEKLAASSSSEAGSWIAWLEAAAIARASAPAAPAASRMPRL